MNLICVLSSKHKWRFSHNHGIPLGSNMSYDEVHEGFISGKFYSVDECTRKGCNKQSRRVNGKRVMVPYERS